MSYNSKIEIKHYLINVRIRCIDNLPELKARGYPMTFKGFRKYKFAIHRIVLGLDNFGESWVVTDMSSGIAFNGGFDTRMNAAENAYLKLKTHKEKFIKKIQEFQWVGG